MQGFIKQII